MKTTTKVPNAIALDDTARLKALARTGLMDSEPEPTLDRLTRLVSKLLDAPVSLISLINDHRQFFKSQYGLSAAQNKERGTPLSHSFCQHVVTSAQPLIVFDARTDKRMQDNLAVRDFNIVAYLGIPLLTTDGLPLGSLCAIDSKPRQWSEDDLSVLNDLAIAVQSEISLRLALDDAQTMSTERDLLIGELNHRVENLFTLMSGMIDTTAHHSETPADMANALRKRLHALAAVHDLIRPATSGDTGEDGGTNLQDIATVIVAPYDTLKPISIDGPALLLNAHTSAQIALTLNELATNAAKYGALSHFNGALSLSWGVADDYLVIDWRETLPNAKTTPPSTSDGFGTRLIDGIIVDQMDGTLKRTWHDDGLQIIMTVPFDSIN